MALEYEYRHTFAYFISRPGTYVALVEAARSL